MRLAALLVLLVLAGCAQPAPLPRASADPPYALACPPGPNATLPGGACSGVLADLTAQLSEPALALQPGHPEVMAVAVHVLGAAAAARGQDVGGRVYVTTDGGATWTPRELPIPGPAGTSFSDPSVGFDANGTLYAAGMAVTLGTGSPIFVVASQDLGKTWGEPALLTSPQSSNDREWLAVAPWGEAFVSWQVPGDQTSHVAWSADGGASWAQAGGPAGCRNAGPVAFVGPEAWVGCSEGGKSVKLFRVDVARRALVPASELPLPTITPVILPEPGGGLVVAGYYDVLARSDDGGRSWSPVVDLRAELPFASSQPDVVTYSAALDPAGWVHLTLAPYHRGANGGNQNGEAFAAEHVVLDPRSFAVKNETRLTSTAPEREAAPPESVVPSTGDDWWGEAFAPAPARGALVWMEGGQVHVASLRPG